MANYIKENVIVVDTTGFSFPQNTKICGIKSVGGGSGGVINIQSGIAGTEVIYEATNAANIEKFEQVEINAPQGINVTLTLTAKVYIYLEV